MNKITHQLLEIASKVQSKGHYDTAKILRRVAQADQLNSPSQLQLDWIELNTLNDLLYRVLFGPQHQYDPTESDKEVLNGIKEKIMRL